MQLKRIIGIAVLFVLSSCQSQHVSELIPSAEYFKSDSASTLPFSDAVRVGHMLYLSGHLGISPNTNSLVSGGIKEETKQTMENIKRTLERYGSSLDQVVKCTVMLADIRDYADMNSVYSTYFPKHFPARSTFATNGLAVGARVEIDCLATVK